MVKKEASPQRTAHIKKVKTNIFFILVQCGNYMKCTENFCTDGACSVMSTSPSPLRIGSDFQLSFFSSPGANGETWSVWIFF